MTSARLHIEIRGYWHTGGGVGSGAVADALVQRDSGGLPVLPGRHLKGLLREAVDAAGLWGWSGYEGLATVLFGERDEDTDSVPSAGALRVSDATLPPETAAWLAGTEAGRALRPGLFRTLHATAVDSKTGTAMDQSLRGIEVVVPLELEARITPVGSGSPADWGRRLEQVLPLVRAVGAQRQRGLGRAILSLKEETA
ncbi:RAMP superfamily CRISPR-associated protein [Thiohalospira sp.]|uniref:RAMP superfamily CRISPR-associated protein n=1 Tax=Thiohalospira sp. TaxID=3080549 RepID=UPI00397F513D